MITWINAQANDKIIISGTKGRVHGLLTSAAYTALHTIGWANTVTSLTSDQSVACIGSKSTTFTGAFGINTAGEVGNITGV
jgi:hypothetical protein